MAIKPRIVVLPVAALVIAGLCAYRLSHSEDRADTQRTISIPRQAPLFELYDQRKPPQLIRLKSFLGRHDIVIVFFDETVGLEQNPVLNWLRQHADALRSQNVKVFAISGALPQVHRKMLDDWLAAEDELPLMLLSDLNGQVHQQYGCFDAVTQQRLPGVFLIDRAGNLPSDTKHPLALEDPIAKLQETFAEK